MRPRRIASASRLAVPALLALVLLAPVAALTGCPGGGGQAAPPDLAAAPPVCNDALRNGAETDVDCGGPDCRPCGEMGACAAPGAASPASARTAAALPCAATTAGRTATRPTWTAAVGP